VTVAACDDKKTSPDGLALTSGQHRRLAEVLLRAAGDRRAIEPLSEWHRELTCADAGRVRDMVLACRLAAGERLIGAKVSLGPTARAAHRGGGGARPRLGWLTDAMLLPGGEVAAGHLIAPRVEPKLAFLVARTLRRPIATVSDLLAATYRVFPCLEVVDSRYGRDHPGPADDIADNCGTGRLLLGRGVPPPAEGHLRRMHVHFEVDGTTPERASSGRAAAVAAPEAAVWLGNRWIRTARALLPGTLLTSTAAAPAVALAPLARIAASFRGIGSVELQVAGARI
jgi:2-keto-4-pentenoate hydratase